MNKPAAEKIDSTYWQEVAKLFSETMGFGQVGFVKRHSINSDTSVHSSDSDEAINDFASTTPYWSF